MANQLKVWDGTAWLDKTPQVWDGAAWVPKSPLLFDGFEWRSEAPTPKEFPAYVASTNAQLSGGGTCELALPADLRMNDYVLAIAASEGTGTSPRPVLMEPAVPVVAYELVTANMTVQVALWAWEPTHGTKTCWDMNGAAQAAAMNLVYRYGDIANVPASPVTAETEHGAVNRVPLMASQDYTSVFLVLTQSTDLTGSAWPEGVIGRSALYGQFGAYQIGILAADTPGAGASAGDLVLDTTVTSAACLLITIPGVFDGQPTWILGDSANSSLDTTTYLG